jgi:hypothetical protein
MPSNIERAAEVLVWHQRRDIGACICGWGVDAGNIGQSHSAHVAQVLADAGIIPGDDADEYEEYAGEYHGPPTYIGCESDSIEGVRRHEAEIKRDPRAIALLGPIVRYMRRTVTTHRTPWQPVEDTDSEVRDDS